MPFKAGDFIGPYEVVQQIGAGGMATVYQAYHAKLDRYVAVKLLHQTFVEDGGFLSRFEREARIIARLDHPHIVPVYDYDEGSGQPYLVMKFIEGITLKEILAEDTLPLDDILDIMTSVADALTYAHQQGILHRDIKPSNIMIDRRGTAYLTDFGLARITQAGESTMSADMMLGTPHYISPEQARGVRDLDGRTDVYSLGVILYQLVVGRVPYSGDTPYAIVHHHIYSTPPLPSSINPDIPPAVEQVLLKALAKQPQDRYNTPMALMTAFREAVSASGLEGLKADPAVGREAPLIDYQPASEVGVPSPTSKDPANQKKVIVERRFDAGEMDLGDLGRRIESTVKQGAGFVGNLVSQIQEQIERERKPLTEEERIRLYIEKRDKARQGLFVHAMFYVIVNLTLWAIWANSPDMVGALGSVIDDPDVMHMIGMFGKFPWPIFVTFFWGIGMIADLAGYYSKYGPGAARRERQIQRELEKSRLRSNYVTVPDHAEKAKRKRRGDMRAAIRLTEDGELTESYAEEWDDDQRRRWS